jgi:hypothetical protein
MIAKQQRRRNRWALQPCLDVRISVLNKTLQRSIQRRYPAFQTPNDQPALNYSGYQNKKNLFKQTVPGLALGQSAVVGCSRAAYSAIFAFSAASILRLVFVIIRSV